MYSFFLLYLLYIGLIGCWTLIHDSCCVLNKMIWHILAFSVKVTSSYQVANVKKQQSKKTFFGRKLWHHLWVRTDRINLDGLVVWLSIRQFHMFGLGSRERGTKNECSCEMNILWDWHSVNGNSDTSLILLPLKIRFRDSAAVSFKWNT